MEDDGKVLRSIYAAIDKTNELLPPDQRMKKSEDTPLFDEGGSLDSLGLVNFLVAVEESVEESLGKSIDITSIMGELAKTENPLRTVRGLVGYIKDRVKKTGEGDGK